MSFCRTLCSPHTLHPTPHTLHPTPYTPHPTPHTLHPTPHSLGLVYVSRGQSAIS
ncbi:DNA gyrase subunit A [Microcystis aeruginosa NIES-44]|uniref:DNA gyrase subunit A n=1 Tax=Microcystis aeruginosa NIES-44 TaxID=449439 RepID=A0A0A1W1P5_MICAE|nr:DNA gyrase subunit A [Microcystis aeruginosa NIES-44]